MTFLNEWLESKNIPEEYKKETKALVEKGDKDELNDRFYKELSFGTAGLRGKLGEGTNRMNDMTVARAAQGIASYISELGEEAKQRGIVIAYDIRHKSKEFARLSAEIFAANGIRVYLFDDFKTTPLLSFSVLNLKTKAGIMITASHNPKDYNGYKVYWEDGAQISFEISDGLSQKIKGVGGYGIYKSFEVGQEAFITRVGGELEESFFKSVLSYDFNAQFDDTVKIVYTPLNGTGNLPVRFVLEKSGFKNVYVVPEQELPDPDFTTVGYPNPEDPKAFKLSEKLAKEVKADLLIATDPDCDRLAIGLFDDEKFVYPSGNQIGILMVDFLTSHLPKEILKKSFMVKSIVTGSLVEKIAKSRGVEFYDALTGFKNICAKAMEVEKESGKKFIFGFEESIGFLYGNHARDKDAVIAARLIAIMAGYAKLKGFDFLKRLGEIYEEFGFTRDLLVQKILEGEEGQLRFKDIMNSLRSNPPKEAGGLAVINTIDYLNHSDKKLRADVLCFNLEGAKLSLRPSGTEPKLKFYLESTGETNSKAIDIENRLKAFVDTLIEG